MKKLWLCLMLIYSSFAFSQDLQEIEIIKVLDCNLFLSSDSQLIKLAYVKSPSAKIHGETSWTLWIKKFATVQLINRPLYYIPVYSSLNRDTLYVHLYRGKKENLENINEYYLRLQCGEYFKPPDLPDLIAYKDAVNNPLPYSPKVIDPDFEEKFIDEQVQENKEAEINKPVNRAAWIQIGLFTLSTHYRMNKYVVSLGYDAFSGSVNRLSNIWGAFGLSANSNWIDASLSMGVSSASRKHYTENENHDIIKSKGNMGLIFKGQVLPHFKHVFGMGLELTYNWSKDKECSYGWATIIIALGNWSN